MEAYKRSNLPVDIATAFYECANRYIKCADFFLFFFFFFLRMREKKTIKCAFKLRGN